MTKSYPYLDAHLEDNQLLAPREVTEFFSKLKCLVCGAPLETNPNCFRDTNKGMFSAYSDCSEDVFHYEVFVSWKDPKKIMINHEEVKFEHEDRFYTVRTQTSHRDLS